MPRARRTPARSPAMRHYHARIDHAVRRGQNGARALAGLWYRDVMSRAVTQWRGAATARRMTRGLPYGTYGGNVERSRPAPSQVQALRRNNAARRIQRAFRPRR